MRLLILFQIILFKIYTICIYINQNLEYIKLKSNIIQN